MNDLIMKEMEFTKNNWEWAIKIGITTKERYGHWLVSVIYNYRFFFGDQPKLLKELNRVSGTP